MTKNLVCGKFGYQFTVFRGINLISNVIVLTFFFQKSEIWKGKKKPKIEKKNEEKIDCSANKSFEDRRREAYIYSGRTSSLLLVLPQFLRQVVAERDREMRGFGRSIGQSLSRRRRCSFRSASRRLNSSSSAAPPPPSSSASSFPLRRSTLLSSPAASGPYLFSEKWSRFAGSSAPIPVI